MRKINGIVLFLFCTLFVYGQVSWNVKAGMNLSRISGFGEVSMKPGYQFGIGMDYFFTVNWGIQPSLMLTSKGYKSNGDYYFPTWQENPRLLKSYDISENRIYIGLPVMLAYRFNISNNMKLVLNGGGYLGYGIAGKFKNINTLEDGSESKDIADTFGSGTERFDTGLGAGTTFEFKNRYTIGLFGEWGLKSAYWHSNNQACGLNVGYKF
jgi:hypothetical protein